MVKKPQLRAGTEKNVPAAPAADNADGEDRPVWKRGSRAYNLVVLAVAVTLLNIWIGSTLPLWSHQIQRDKEAELIFRGKQYAEAIRIFQLRYQRFPTSLKELIEVEPRCIRQLWPNPMREDGRWGLVPVGQGGQVIGPNQDQNLGGGDGNPNGRSGSGGSDGFGSGKDGKDAGVILSADPDDTFAAPSTVPIRGVFAADSEDAIHTFLGKENTGEWKFTIDLVSAVKPGDPSNPGLQTPFLASELGRVFPPGVVPPVPQPSDQPQQQQQQPGQTGGSLNPTPGNPGNAPGNPGAPVGNPGSDGHLGNRGKG